VPERLDAELLLARAELATGQRAAAHKRLAALVAEARAKGFLLVVSRATAAAR
jgi:hypothetical protein